MSDPNFAPAELSSRLGFATNRLLRHSELRDDEADIARRRQHPEARTFVIAGDIPILRRLDKGPGKLGPGRLGPGRLGPGRLGPERLGPERLGPERGEPAALSARFTLAEAAGLGTAREVPFLGMLDGVPLFATLLDAERGEALKPRDDLLVIDLRSIAVQGLVPPEELGPLGEAKSLLYWHERHRFCSNCGAPTRMAAGGWRRECDACAAHHFPRTDPVVIMLARRGDKCLLGRQRRFLTGMYSCLAGFVEPGETIEDAVRRETREEAGIRVGRVDYLCSQPWPFPASLMIGCLAEALDEALAVDTQELEDARWFPRQEAALMIAGRHPDGLICPPPIAIAHHLLRVFVAGGQS